MAFAATINTTRKLEIYDCYACGSPIALDDHHEKRLQDDGSNFFCPRGHTQSFTHSETTRLRKMLEEANRSKTAITSQLTQALDDVKNARVQQRRSATLLKNQTERISHGVCPCCNRTFKQLAAHMKNKHPEFKV